MFYSTVTRLEMTALLFLRVQRSRKKLIITVLNHLDARVSQLLNPNQANTLGRYLRWTARQLADAA